MTSVAVIGAGLSGLVVARRLQPLADVTVFEKSRGPGGRIATRYSGAFEFDHGAQFFTARSERFRSFLQPLMEQGVIAEWHGSFAEFDRSTMTTLRSWDEDYPHFVGTPRMNSIGKALSADVNVVFETEISTVSRTDAGWTLATPDGKRAGAFDWLVVTSPAAQAAALAADCPELVAFCDQRSMLGCFALMLGFEQPINLPMQAATVRNSDISWISVNSSKPARKTAFTVVVHSTNAWANTNIDSDIDDVLTHMFDETSEVTGKDLSGAVHRQVHRWRYANTGRQAGPTCFLDSDVQIAACGDWCIHGRIEAAFTSASDLSDALVGSLEGN